jgi:hypothetical protein
VWAADVYPVAGPAPVAGELRTVGFTNRAGRTVTLTVGDQTLELPADTAVSAKVPATFAWTLDGGPDRRTEIPANATGVEVVIRK